MKATWQSRNMRFHTNKLWDTAFFLFTHHPFGLYAIHWCLVVMCVSLTLSVYVCTDDFVSVTRMRTPLRTVSARSFLHTHTDTHWNTQTYIQTDDVVSVSIRFVFTSIAGAAAVVGFCGVCFVLCFVKWNPKRLNGSRGNENFFIALFWLWIFELNSQLYQ